MKRLTYKNGYVVLVLYEGTVRSMCETYYPNGKFCSVDCIENTDLYIDDLVSVESVERML